jgi:hypothetical protein
MLMCLKLTPADTLTFTYCAACVACRHHVDSHALYSDLRVCILHTSVSSVYLVLLSCLLFKCTQGPMDRPCVGHCVSTCMQVGHKVPWKVRSVQVLLRDAALSPQAGQTAGCEDSVQQPMHHWSSAVKGPCHLQFNAEVISCTCDIVRTIAAGGSSALLQTYLRQDVMQQ